MLKSKHLFWLMYLFILAVHFLYYPKWNKTGTESTISWDVAGYYMYLPAIFIYDDLKKCSFKDSIIKKYRPIPNFNQAAFKHEKSGNYVMKYSIGQALQYAPFFFIAHVWASNSETYDADGFSFPYQFIISIFSLFFSFIGLYYLRKILLLYFDDLVVGLSLLALVLGTNYLNYSAIDGAMAHNNLFAIYCLLIYFCIKFYRKPGILNSVIVGLLIGLAALTRPTEIIALIIPLLWGLDITETRAFKKRFVFLVKNIRSVLISIFCCLIVGSVQIIYWKYISGQWIVYSYQEQGFSWFKPHIIEGLFSFGTGWLPYTPMMLFSIIGIYYLFKIHKKIFLACSVFIFLFIYIAFAWDIYWYGGSLGQRTMVQAYPILLFPLSCFFDQVLKQKYKFILFPIFICFCYINLWFTHQAHKGDLLPVGQVTGAYYWKTLGTFTKVREHLKLLDTDELFEGKASNIRTIYSGTDQIYLNDSTLLSKIFKIEIDDDFDWIRASADFKTNEVEKIKWDMTKFIVRFKYNDEIVKSRKILIQRHLIEINKGKNIFIDVKKPNEKFNKIEISFLKSGRSTDIGIKDLKVELFNE